MDHTTEPITMPVGGEETEIGHLDASALPWGLGYYSAFVIVPDTGEHVFVGSGWNTEELTALVMSAYTGPVDELPFDPVLF